MTFEYLTAMRLPLTGMALGLLLPINASLAASSATAEMDWSHFQIQTLFGNVSISPNNSYTSSSSDVNDYVDNLPIAFDYQTASDWSDSLSTSAVDAFASAASSADANSLHAEAQSGYDNRYAEAFLKRHGNYNLRGSGVIEISVPYSLFALSEPDSDYASSRAQLNVSFINGSFSDDVSRSASLFNVAYLENQETSRNGLLSLIFRVDGDASLNFYANVFTNAHGLAPVPVPVPVPAAVPVPGAAWLMGSALLGFLSMTRRQK